MKEFNLEAALNGEPICASEQKCYVVREVTEFLDDKSVRKFVVIFPDSSAIAEIWSEYDFEDDIAMWEEPKISIEDLPKPFQPKYGEPYFYICGFNVYKVKQFYPHARFDSNNAKHGQCFRTAEDAQKWIDFMKSMVE